MLGQAASARGLVRRRDEGGSLAQLGRYHHAAFAATFWDGRVGAFRDTGASDVHPLDGNAFAILAGVARPAQAQSALAYIDRTMTQPYGNVVADTSSWRGWNWNADDRLRVYPFLSYFEVLARYSVGAAPRRSS